MFGKYVSKFFVSSILVFVAFLSVAAQQLPQYPKMSNQAADDMAKTWTFYVAQTLLVKAYSEKFPTLSEDLKKAQLLFDAKFADSISNIDSILLIENRPWKSTKEEMFQTIEKAVDIQKQQATYNQAAVFLEGIKKKTAGDIPSPYLETLLIYKTDFLKQPAEELIKGYKRDFSTKGNPKSKGVNFQISYPMSWKANEGKRPNVITLIDSENGRGLEDVILAVKELPIPERKLSLKEEKELFSQDIVKEMLPSNAKLISSTPMKIDGLSSMAVVFDLEQIQLDFKLKSRWLFFITLYKNKLIFLQFSVTSHPIEEKQLDSQFKKFEPLFRLMANSLIVQSQYQ